MPETPYRGGFILFLDLSATATKTGSWDSEIANMGVAQMRKMHTCAPRAKKVGGVSLSRNLSEKHIIPARFACKIGFASRRGVWHSMI
jgi:hypothetical protein